MTGQIIQFSRKELPVQSMSDLKATGDLFSRSGIFGDINDSIGFLVALTCYQERLSPVDFVKKYDIIKGKITKKAKAMLAEFKCFGGKIKIKEYSDFAVEIHFFHKSDDINIRLTAKDAVQQGIATKSDGSIKDMWQKFTRRMLFARVISEGVGLLCPGITTGIYTPEEVADFTQEEVRLNADEDYTPSGEEIQHSTNMQSDTTSVDVETCYLGGKYYGVRWENIVTEDLELALTANLPPEVEKHVKSILIVRKEQ